jgi:hypothetical protein
MKPEWSVIREPPLEIRMNLVGKKDTLTISLAPSGDTDYAHSLRPKFDRNQLGRTFPLVCPHANAIKELVMGTKLERRSSEMMWTKVDVICEALVDRINYSCMGS